MSMETVVAESEDSDTEGGRGNVNKMIMRPPGHSGKAKKGHICFDASFETGNLGRVDLISEFEYDLFIRPDTCNPRLRLWFNFTVDNVKSDQRVVFNIVNMSKNAGLFRNGMTPLVKSSSKSRWQRIPNDQVRHYAFLIKLELSKRSELTEALIVGTDIVIPLISGRKRERPRR